MKKKLMVSSIVAASFLFSGCSLTMSEAINKDINEYAKNDMRPKMINGVNLPNLNKEYKENISTRKFISFEDSLSLKKVLSQLEEIDGKRYFLDRNSENITFPESRMTARSFGEVANYLAKTTGKIIYVELGNALYKNSLQVVKIKSAKAEKYNFSKIPFNLNLNISVKEALKLLKENPDFVFSLNIDYEDFEAQSNNRLFEDVFISYKGTNIQEFFDYLEQKLNVFIGVDYDSKIIRIHKYEKQFFQLIIDNKKITGTLGGGDTSVTKESEAKEGKLSQKVNIDIYSELTGSLDKILIDAKSRKNNNAYYDIDEQTGSIEIYADKRTVKEFQKKIEEFNSGYTDMIEVEFINVEIILTKDYLLKTGVDFTRISGDKTTSFKSPFNIANNLLSVAKENSSSGSITNLLFQSAQEFGYVVDKDTKKWKLRNHIPKSLNEMKTSRYLKNILIADPTTDAGTQKAETETDIITEPENYSITAHYSNNQISLVISNAIGKLTDMQTLKAGDTEVSNPITKSIRSNNDAFMRNGDIYIMEDSMSIESSKKYEGILPTDWIALNAIGGGNAESLIYSQRISMVRAVKVHR